MFYPIFAVIAVSAYLLVGVEASFRMDASYPPIFLLASLFVAVAVATVAHLRQEGESRRRRQRRQR